tara:strand:+ start:1563 stop:2039 length:477 start_codon:yes stop_codon:yes gene_type:complete
MSRLLILTFAIISCNSATVDRNFVFDYEDLLNEKQEVELQRMIGDHEAKTTNEIALVTTPDWGEKSNALFFSVNFGEKHGIGKKEKNNGIVIVVSKQQREARISTGYGTEEVLKDEIAKQIIDSLMIPRFKEDKYFEGIKDGTQEIIDFLEQPGNEIK